MLCSSFERPVVSEFRQPLLLFYASWRLSADAPGWSWSAGSTDFANIISGYDDWPQLGSCPRRDCKSLVAEITSDGARATFEARLCFSLEEPEPNL